MIKHHGAVNGVTGSCHELICNDVRTVLIDCGLCQGAETSGKGASFEHLEIEFPADQIQALIITHVHIDHVGRFSYLLDGKRYYIKAKVYTILGHAEQKDLIN